MAGGSWSARRTGGGSPSRFPATGSTWSWRPRCRCCCHPGSTPWRRGTKPSATGPGVSGSRASVIPEPRLARQERGGLEQYADVQGMQLDSVVAHRLGLARDPDTMLGGPFLHPVQRRDLGGQHPAGRAADAAQLASEHLHLVSAGMQLLRNKNIEASPAVRAPLLAGQVDPRLLVTLSALASAMPVRLVTFDDSSPGTSTVVALRGAEIGAASTAGLSAMLAFLHAQQAPYLPAAVTVARNASGQSLVTVRYDAPGLMDVGVVEMDCAGLKRLIVMLLAAAASLSGLSPAATAFASSATTGTGWIRLAHLSPAASPVDVYLYSFGDSSAHIVLHHVAYGTVSPYEAVTAGDYSVAMRPAGAPATSQPVLSTTVTIVAGHAYTVAGLTAAVAGGHRSRVAARLDRRAEAAPPRPVRPAFIDLRPRLSSFT